MGPYNLDLERVQRCLIHYATPDGRIIPFCAMNNIHRQIVEKKYAQPITKESMTPLCDVASLCRRIMEEEKASDDRWFLDNLPTIVQGGEPSLKSLILSCTKQERSMVDERKSGLATPKF